MHAMIAPPTLLPGVPLKHTAGSNVGVSQGEVRVEHRLPSPVCVCVQLFETMTEVMQGPCPGNQLLLSQSRMLEAVNGIWNAIVTAQHHRDRFPAARLPCLLPLFNSNVGSVAFATTSATVSA